jgi:hypothetical protein
VHEKEATAQMASGDEALTLPGVSAILTIA